jgi:parallel beta-helix repeat protein
MKKYIKIILAFFFIFLLPNIAFAYQIHEPIIIRQPIEGNSANNPLIIEGFEITNPKGPCIFVENVEHVIVRNNYLYDCGTDFSAELIANNTRDDDCLGGGTDFMETGALNLFRVGSVKVYNNKFENNDYAIRIDGFDINNKVNGVEVFNNQIYNTHRNFFLWVKDSKNVLIYNNDIRHNGLDEFFDNAALEKIFGGEELGCMDGRSQGIVVFSCDDVNIYNNFILNSSSDGIGIMGSPGDPFNSNYPSTNVEIYDNEVVENGEQGIWLAGAHNVSIYNNKVYQSKHRIGEQGGSSGIMLEIDAVDVRIFNNEIYYNDMYGISITAGTNVDIYENNISYNGEGGIGLTHLYYVVNDGIKNINISNNFIHNNRICGVTLKNNYSEDIFVEKNIFKNNSGNPIHHGYYIGHDFSQHLEDWVLTDECVFMAVPKEMTERVTFRDNLGYNGKESSEEKNSILEKPKSENSSIEKEVSEKNIIVGKKEPKGIFYVIEQLIESWEATLGVIIILVVITLILYYKRKKI